ncbi:hypothetical protein CPC08DRAFT_69632 [Agrocybe pediades]|nr:hypothetical protein CPC08DRAFT_69632 [Agrocybe pediades]
MPGGQKSWQTTVGISSATSRLSGSAGLPITPHMIDEGDEGLTLIYDNRSSASSSDSNTKDDAFFEGYRAGMRMQFEEDQVILSGYRDHIAQLEQEVNEYQRLEVIKDEARREERDLQSQLLNNLDLQHARAIQEVREELRRQRVEMEERYRQCKIREGRYRERVLSLTKELNEARDDLLALRIAYGEFDDDYFESEGQAGNINPYLPWINSPVSPLSPTSISFSSESTLSSLSAGALQEIAVDVDMGLNDERKICFQRSVSVEEPEAEAIKNPATWKGKGKEVFVDVIEHELEHGFANKRRYRSVK